MLRVVKPGVRIPAGAKGFLFSPKHSDFLEPNQPVIKRVPRTASLARKAAGVYSWSSVQVRNGCSYTSTYTT
jgi:hypothetical protein